MLSNETYERLSQVTGGVLGKKLIMSLQIPDSIEERQLEYISARITPVMCQYRFATSDLLMLAIEQHFKQNENASAKVSTKSEKAINALMLADPEKRGASVNPWTYAVEATINE